jgi:hypothetical protein
MSRRFLHSLSPSTTENDPMITIVLIIAGLVVVTAMDGATSR